MHYLKSLLPLASLFFFWDAVASIAPADSVGLERKNGKTLLIYKVAPGQTLYSLLKKYNVTLDEFKAVNPEFSGNLRSHELVRIPRGNMKIPAQAAQPQQAGKQPQTHTVEAGQTLFSISRKYDIGTADLKFWNNLEADGSVKIGQVLYLTDPRNLKQPEAKPAPAKQPPVSAPVAKKPEEKKQDTVKPASLPKPVLATKPEPEPVAAATTRTENDAVPNAGGKRIVEMGLCELIDTQDRTGKYLALHRTAPIGTMLTVRNEANNQSVMVKVIGKLPDTGMADRIIVRLSAKAFERLMPTDRRVRAEVSYLATEQ